MVSRVVLVTPPRLSPAGEGRIKADVSPASRPMRVLSPRMEPPLLVEVGSTASTATFLPEATRFSPS
jgi:hypothetical protein